MAESNKKNIYVRVILDYILKNKIIDKIKERIFRELEFAVSALDQDDLTGVW